MSHREISKQNNKRKKGNISILVIFVLLASGIIGILTMHFVRQILHYNGTVLSYYRSYYLAQAGMELSLAQTNHRGVGFEYTIHSGDAIVKENFSCYECELTTEIAGTSSNLSKSFHYPEECSEEVAYNLAGGESLVVPLFKDNYAKVNQANIFNDNEVQYENMLKRGLRIEFDFIENPEELSLSLATQGFTTISKKYQNPEKDVIKTFLRDEAYPNDEYISVSRRLGDEHKNYLIIANPLTDDQILSFCLHVMSTNGKERRLATETATIKSIGTYRSKTIGLEAIYQHDVLPSFLGHTTLEF